MKAPKESHELGPLWNDRQSLGSNPNYPAPLSQPTLLRQTSEVGVACSPKTDPCVMRVQPPAWARRTFDERQEAQPGADHQEAA